MENKTEKKIWEYLLSYKADHDNGFNEHSMPTRFEIAEAIKIKEPLVNYYLEKWNKKGRISLVRGHRNIVLGKTKLLKVKKIR